jgi:DNA-binding response OmpR family regulator
VKRVLVVDDDPTVSEVVAGYPNRAGFAVDVAADGPTAVARTIAQPPDLVALDLMLPGMDGLDVCRRIRTGRPATGDHADRARRRGGPHPRPEVEADDYVTKPFSPRELVLRVESVLRHAGAVAAARTAPAEAWLRAGPLALDPTAHRVTRHQRELSLTVREFDLLEYFLRNPGQTTSREDLMRKVWGWEFGPVDRDRPRAAAAREDRGRSGAPPADRHRVGSGLPLRHPPHEQRRRYRVTPS